MRLSHRRLARRAVVLVALSVALVATMVAVARAASPPAAHPHRNPHANRAQITDDGPRNPAAEAATGDTQAMLAIVQAAVDCLRAKGFHPGDPQVQGQNVVIAGWAPAWDSPAGRATDACSFPVR